MPGPVIRKVPFGPGGTGLGPESPSAIRASTSSEKLWDALGVLNRLGLDTPLGKLNAENLINLWRGKTDEERMMSDALDLGMNPLSFPVAVTYKAGQKLGVHGTRTLFDYFKTKLFGHPSQPYSDMINIAAIDRELSKEPERAIKRASDYASAVAAEARYGEPRRAGGYENLRNIPIAPAEDISILDFHTKYDPDAITPEEAEMVKRFLAENEGDTAKADLFAERYESLRRRIMAEAEGTANTQSIFSAKDYGPLSTLVPGSLYEEHPRIKGFIYKDSTGGFGHLPPEIRNASDFQYGAMVDAPAMTIAENTPLQTPWGVPLTEVADPGILGYLPGFSPRYTKNVAKEIPPYVPKPDFDDQFVLPLFPDYQQGVGEIVGVGGKPKYSKADLSLLKEGGEFPYETLDELVDYFSGTQSDVGAKKSAIKQKISSGQLATPEEVNYFNESPELIWEDIPGNAEEDLGGLTSKTLFGTTLDYPTISHLTDALSKKLEKQDLFDRVFEGVKNSGAVAEDVISTIERPAKSVAETLKGTQEYGDFLYMLETFPYTMAEKLDWDKLPASKKATQDLIKQWWQDIIGSVKE